MQIGAAQILRAHHLARGRLDQRRAAQEYCAVALDDNLRRRELAPLHSPLTAVLTDSSAMAGTYAPPAVQLPMTAAICGMPCALMRAWL